jgi:pimeloyl-ACP methyl ester carboxylesterase
VLKSSKFARATLLKIFLSYVVRFRSELGTEIENAVADADPHTAQRLFKAMKRETPISYAHALQKYNCTFLRGRFDRVMSQSTLEEWAAATNGTYVEIEKAAHTPMIEAPSIYAAAIQKLTKEAMEQYRHEEKL